ncbi:MAG: alpha/beta hydrolase [Burkholderiales bacterium]|nr:alpha/beta hydrolase [Burkholderiales bacterium]
MIPDLPLAELARRYNNDETAPDWSQTLLPRWQRDGASLRSQAGGARDLAYGPKPRNRYDLFAPPGRAPDAGWPTFVFIHGGYWQELSKDDWSAIAAPFVRHGMAAAILGYTLCPENTVRGIAAEIVAAIAHLWHHAAELGVDRERLSLAGHSAGGHLTACCLSEDWTRSQLPATPFVRAAAISGIFDLEPLVPIYLNDALKLTRDEALAMSPAYRERRVQCEFIAAVGGAELPEFLRQNRLIGQRWSDVAEWEIPGLNHFTIVDQLTRDDTALFERVAEGLRI